MKEAVRGNKAGLASLCVMAFSLLLIVFSATTRIGFDPDYGEPVLILYVAVPMACVAVIMAVIGLLGDRTQILASISLILIPATMAAAWVIGWISRAF